MTAQPEGTPARVLPASEPATQGKALDQDAVAQAGAQQLGDVRKAAESWRNGLAGLLALITTVSVVKGKSTITEMHPHWRIMLGALTLASLCTGMIGAYLALRAAHGRPRRVTRDEINRRGGLQGYDARQAELAVADLKWATLATVATVILVAGSVGVTWFAPGAKEATYIEVTNKAGMVTCGELKPASSATTMLKLPTGHLQVIRLADVEALRSVGSCGSKP